MKLESDPRSETHFQQMFTPLPLVSVMGKLERNTVQAFNVVYCVWTSVRAVDRSKPNSLETQEGAKDDVESGVTHQTPLLKK